MSSPPAVAYGPTLVISDGPDRVVWRRIGRAAWAPHALWPDERQAAEVLARLGRREPTLVLLSGTDAAVPLLDEQLALAPPAIAARAERIGGDLASLRIPALDWLPVQLRRRGLLFARASAREAASLPRPLRPSLVLEPRDPQTPHLRFANRIGPCPHLHRDLPAIVAHAFGAPSRSAAA